MRAFSVPHPVLAGLLLAAAAPAALAAGTTEQVSVSSGGQPGNGLSGTGSVNPISADGRFVVFDSGASNLVPGDTNNAPDAFVHDLRTGTTERVSVRSGGAECPGGGTGPLLSQHGRFVAFTSGTATCEGGVSATVRAFVHDRKTNTTAMVSVGPGGVEANDFSVPTAISLSGRFVAIVSRATNLVPGDTNGQPDVFIHDRRTGTTERVSVSSRGKQGNGFSSDGTMSADARFVAFDSEASNLVPGDTNGVSDTFVHDRKTGATRRVSIGTDGQQGNGRSLIEALSWSGRTVVFNSEASNLVPNDSNGAPDVFVRVLPGGR
jgi:Tol biopolymer transport system component